MSMDTYNQAGLSAEELELLAYLMEEEGLEVADRQTIFPRTQQSNLPLSFAQQRLWFLDQWEPGNAAYNIPFTLRLKGRLNVSALQQALNAIVARHEALRTTFATVDGQPVQVISPPQPVPLPVADLSDLPPDEREAEALRLALASGKIAFDLASGALVRAQLVRLGPDEHVFLLNMHHIISDGWSTAVFQREMVLLYDAFDRNQPMPLDDLPIQYADFAIWQRQWLQGEVLQEQLEYWRKQLAALPTLDLPTDRPRPPAQSYRGTYERMTIPASLTAALENVGKRFGATLFMTILVAFQVLLHRYSDQDDIAVGSPIANRDLVEVEPLIGFFVNTLILRSNLVGNPRFCDLLAEVRETTLAAYAHQNVPFEQLVEVLKPERDPSRPPLFQVMFALQNMPLGVKELAELTVEPVRVDTGASKFDLMLGLAETPTGLRGSIEYSTDLFDQTTIQRMIGHFLMLLEQIIAAPEQRIGNLPILTPAERSQLLVAWNDTATIEVADGCIHHLIEAQAAQTPDAIAVISGDCRLTYADLDRRANQLAHYLQARGVQPETPVAICLDKSLDLIVAMLGVLKAGGCYVPLDPTLPRERLLFMLADTQAPLLISHQALSSLQAQIEGSLNRTSVVDLDLEAAAIARQPDSCPRRAATGANLAYIIYTSGSTGQPKGTLVPHRNLVNAAQAWEAAYQLRATVRRHLQMANVAFDVFAGDVVRALCFGGTLVLCPRDLLLAPEQLYALMAEHQIDCAEFVPAVLRGLVQHLLDHDLKLDGMKLLVCGSDSWYVEEYRQLQRLCGVEARVVNSFGTTETTIDSTWLAAVPEQHTAEQLVPIGRPFANTRLYIVDRYRQPAPVGVPGELWIGGAGVARGYLRRPALTAEKFIPDPFGGKPGARLYRTGDRARYLPDGTVEFLGRIDFQVKIRGFRIELDEINAALEQQPDVQDSVVVAHTDASGTSLVAYVVARPEHEPSAANLRSHLKQTLPDYMIPAAFMFLETLPLTPNGKVDRRALPEPELDRRGRDGIVAPRTPAEELVANVWSAVLGVPLIGAFDNFFELGGHSLLATQVIARLRGIFGPQISLRLLFEAPVVAELADRLQAQQAGQHLPSLPLRRYPRDGQIPLSFAQQRLWFLDQLEPESTVYTIPLAVRLRGALDVGALERSLSAIVGRHEALRTTFAAVDGVPVQMIAPAQPHILPIVEIPALPADERDPIIRQLVEAQTRQPFDLGRGPLLRSQLVRLAPDDHLLLLTVHHIVFDGWSFAVLTRELTTLYTAYSAGQTDADAILPDLTLQYADYGLWQREWLHGAVLEQQLNYWQERLQPEGSSAPVVLELPTDYPRPAVPSHEGASHVFEIPADLTAALRTLSQRENATLFMTLLAAWQTLLYRYSGQDDIVVGTPIAGRTRLELEQLIGFFVNTLVLRTELAGQPTFAELLARVRTTALDAYAHQDVPFELIVEQVQAERDLSRTPLFQVMFVLQNTPRATIDLHGVTLEPVSIAGTSADFDITLTVNETEQELVGTLQYRTDLFAAESIERMAACFQTLLEAVVADPSQRIDRLPLLPAAERQLLQSWTTHLPLPSATCLHDLLAAQTARTPNASAVEYEGATLTYAELDQQANRLAHYLRSLGVGPEIRVGICLHRTISFVVAVLGVVKAGGCYVPLDPAYPQERLGFMLHDAEARVLLTETALEPLLPPFAGAILNLDQAGDLLDRQPTHVPDVAVYPDNLLLIIYTSGSTGQPKGVLLTHRNLVSYLLAARERYPLTEHDRLLQFASVSFDTSAEDLYTTLTAGATLVLRTEEMASSAETFAAACTKAEITVLSLPTAFWHVLAEASAAETFTLPGSVRRVCIGGEHAALDRVHQWQARYGARAALYNLYGPTEATIGVTGYPVPEALPATLPDMPIGRVLANVRGYVLDAQLERVPVGVPGELYIGGEQLARGYGNRPDLTAARFIPDPWSAELGARLYRTGDWVRALADGTLIFQGRTDTQVKLRGFRIELGEVAAALRTHAAVRDALVLLRDERLVAYVVQNPEPRTQNHGDEPDDSRSPSGNPVLGSPNLRSFLGSRLPDYMVPTAYVLLDAWPLLPNGKLDHKALPEPELGSERTTLTPPRTPTEELIASVWARVLGLEQVGIHDNFFALGGHSLLATQVVSRLRQMLNVEVPLRLLMEAPTIAEFASRLGNKQTNSLPLLPVPADGRALPLSFAQQRLWLLDQLQPGSRAYHMPLVVRLLGRIDPAAMQRSLTAVVERHESLRTTFAIQNQQPVQVIAPALAVPLPLDVVPNTAEQESVLSRQVRDEIEQPFDLAQGPLLRARLLRLSDAEHVLILVMHHIVTDGWSQSVLLRELTTLYRGFGQDEPVHLPALPVQYADYAVWQRQWLQGEVLEQQLSYWRRQLHPEGTRIAPLDLPADYPRPPVATENGAYLRFQLPATLSGELNHLSQQLGSTQFMTLLAAFDVLLYRYSGQHDIAVGSPIAGRVRPELEDLIGFFVNTLVLRTDLAGQPSFAELLARVRTTALDAYAHQDVPFELIVEQVQPERDLSRTPLFQVMFVLQNTPSVTIDLDDLTVEPFGFAWTTAKFDLTLNMTETEQGFVGVIEYRTDLFAAATIERMAGHFQMLLEAIVADPNQRIDRLPLMTGAEQQMLVEWNRSAAEYPREATIHQLFEAQAERTPDRRAVVFEDQSLTYADLNARANQLAHYLRSQGVGPDVLVALCVERSLEMIVGMLAILKAGGAYVPLDPAYPAERLAYMLAHSRAPVILTQAALVERLPEHQAQVFCLDADWERLNDQPIANPLPAALPDHLAYIIFTSGSTGRPKGVMVTQQGVINLVYGLRAYFDDPAVEVTGLITSISFDISVNQIFPTLIFGRTLHIIPDPVKFNSRALLRYLHEHQIHLLDAVPSYLQAVLNEVAPEQMPNALRYLLIGGEKLEQRLLHAVFGQLGSKVAIVNIYGLTEISDINILGKIGAEDADKPITAGRPLQNNRIYILNRADQPQPIGVAGEVCVSGESVSRGYLFRPELTAERFVACPFEDGQIMVRTGDLGRWRPDGTVEILGRIDHQVKIRGFRIETGEIEAVLAQHPGISECVVVVREDVPGDKRLVAYVVQNQDTGCTPGMVPGTWNQEDKPDGSGFLVLSSADLRAFLQQYLPDHMIPTAFVALDTLPKTPSGKLDRRALPAPDLSRPDLDQTFVAPRTPEEQTLAEIWQAVLGIPQIGIHDNFFAVGGHSLLAVHLMGQIQQRFGQALPLTTLFQAPTIELLAARLRKVAPGTPWSPLVALQPHGTKPPLFLIHAVGGTVLSYADLARLLGPDQPVYGLQARGIEPGQTPHTTIEAMAAEYLTAIREIQPDGPYLLGGWSLGGVVAFELARQLQEIGQAVARVILLDSFPPPSAPIKVDDLTLLLHFARDLGGLMGRKFALTLEELRANAGERPLDYVLAQARAQGVVSPEIEPEQMRRLAEVFQANQQAALAYRPQPLALDLLLLQAGDTPGADDEPDLATSWRALANSVEAAVVPGNHYTLLRSPQVQSLAAQIQAAL